MKLIKESKIKIINTNNNEQKVINENTSPKANANNYSEAIAAYRKFANLEENVKIVDIDEWALNEAACKYAVRKFDLKDALLTEQVEPLEEDVTIDQAARELEAEKEEA